MPTPQLCPERGRCDVPKCLVNACHSAPAESAAERNVRAEAASESGALGPGREAWRPAPLARLCAVTAAHSPGTLATPMCRHGNGGAARVSLALTVMQQRGARVRGQENVGWEGGVGGATSELAVLAGT